MIHTLGHARLSDGERLRIAALEPPCGCYARAIRRFLDHKGQPWLTHVERAERGEVDALRTVYHVGLLGRRIVGNVMIVHDGRAGILGHVFTHPDHRRRGICTHLLRAAVDRFRAAGGLALSLGTGYESPPYWIYHGAGFRGIEPGSGHMLFESRPGDLARHFAPAASRVLPARWEHWPGLSLLYSQPDGDAIRSYAYGVYGPAGFEGGFLRLQTHPVRPHARVLVTRAGSVVGAAIVQRDGAWPQGIHTLDLFVHPNFAGSETRLLGGLKLPDNAKIQAYLDRPSAGRAAVLRDAGFRREATLKDQLRSRERPVDVFVYCRHTKR